MFVTIWNTNSLAKTLLRNTSASLEIPSSFSISLDSLRGSSNGTGEITVDHCSAVHLRRFRTPVEARGRQSGRINAQLRKQTG